MISRISGANFTPSFGSVKIFRSEYAGKARNLETDVFLPMGIKEVMLVHPEFSAPHLPRGGKRNPVDCMPPEDIVYKAREKFKPNDEQALLIDMGSTCHIVTNDPVTDAAIRNDMRALGISSSAKIIDDFDPPIDMINAKTPPLGFAAVKLDLKNPTRHEGVEFRVESTEPLVKLTDGRTPSLISGDAKE